MFRCLSRKTENEIKIKDICIQMFASTQMPLKHFSSTYIKNLVNKSLKQIEAFSA